MTVEQLTSPTDSDYEDFYPLAQLKSDLVIASTKTDNKLARLLRAAVLTAEQTARCVILPSQFRARFDPPYVRGDAFGISNKMVDKDRISEGLMLKGPIISIDSVSEGITAVDIARFRLVRSGANRTTGEIHWLSATGVREERMPSLELVVDYTAGFDNNNSARPSLIQACFEIIAHNLETPGEINDFSTLALPQNALQILQAFWSSRINRRRM